MAKRTKAQRRQHAWVYLTRWLCGSGIARLREAQVNKDFPLNKVAQYHANRAAYHLNLLKQTAEKQYQTKS